MGWGGVGWGGVGQGGAGWGGAGRGGAMQNMGCEMCVNQAMQPGCGSQTTHQLIQDIASCCHNISVL